ncbi:hypothetical protein B0H16DRAFT_1686033 [Mycena metata]|uniref:Uncharacterized protein n=1 Tax=Mycena metata TaxID=1033252 RepID=A0AAD7NPS3_9AGAR|nr:hypothetical protein B0H16DRAFT_1686033 [Mycena metata]
MFDFLANICNVASCSGSLPQRLHRKLLYDSSGILDEYVPSCFARRFVRCSLNTNLKTAKRLPGEDTEAVYWDKKSTVYPQCRSRGNSFTYIGASTSEPKVSELGAEKPILESLMLAKANGLRPFGHPPNLTRRRVLHPNYLTSRYHEFNLGPFQRPLATRSDSTRRRGGHSTITPVDGVLEAYSIRTKLALASPEDVHALVISGGNMLIKVLPLAVASRTVGERPAGHCKAIQDAVFSTEMKAAVMERADIYETSIEIRRAAWSDAMHIFFAALCGYGGIAAGVAWFDAVLGPAVSAADAVYLTFAVPLESAALSQGDQATTTPSHHQALALLLPSTSSSLASPSEKALGNKFEGEDSPSSSSSHAQVAPAGTGKDDNREVDAAAPLPAEAAEEKAEEDGQELQSVGGDAAAPPRIKRLVKSVAGVLIDEGHGFFHDAFPDGVQALAAEGAVAFVSGVWSALASNAPRGQKRKADIAAGTGPFQRRRIQGERRPTRVLRPCRAQATTPTLRLCHHAKPAPSAPTLAAPPPAHGSAPDAFRAPTPPTAQPSAPEPGPSAPVRARRARVPFDTLNVTSPRSGPSVLGAVRTIEAGLSGAASAPTTATPGAYTLFRIRVYHDYRLYCDECIATGWRFVEDVAGASESEEAERE